MTTSLLEIQAWESAQAGRFEEARWLYSNELSLLRHCVGSAKGLIEPPEFDQDNVPMFYIHDRTFESPSSEGLEELPLSLDIAGFIEQFSPGFHKKNITKELPHVLFLSTGRCGTVSFYRLLQGSNVVPYHAYWWNGSITSRWEMLCRLLSREYAGAEPVYQEWLSTRAAEWLGPMTQGRVMVGLNHNDTIYAPIFAALHPESKFVWLRRNEKDVLKSFVEKNQSLGELGNQLRPLLCAFDPSFRWRRTAHTKVECLEWFIRFTGRFAKEMWSVVGDRMIAIRSEDLFSQNEDEIARLLSFIGADVPIDRAVAHFATKINEKAHKCS